MKDMPTLSHSLFPYFEDAKRLMIVGPTDVGKSTFVRDYARYLLGKGEKHWVVDLDVGQSDVGPVGTVAAVRINREFTLLEELDPDCLEFFGYVAPSMDLLSYQWVVRRIAVLLRREERLIIDTTGWVSGYEAFSLKLMKAKIFGVDTVIMVGEWFEGWRRAFEALGIRVHVVGPSPFAISKDKNRRRINRYAATELFFKDKPAVKLRIKDYPLWFKDLSDLSFCLIGGLDERLNTVSVGWVVSCDGKDVVAKMHIIKKVKPCIIKIGQKVTL